MRGQPFFKQLLRALCSDTGQLTNVQGWARTSRWPRHRERLHADHRLLLDPGTLLGTVALGSSWGRTGFGAEAPAEFIMVDEPSDEFFRHAREKGAGGAPVRAVAVLWRCCGGWEEGGGEGGEESA